MVEPMQDLWAQWLLHRRHGGDPEQYARTMKGLLPLRDQVLRNAAIAPGEVVLDVGAGDGLIAFGALDQVGETGQVILSDISQNCLEHCRALAQEAGVIGRCRFVQASADDLTAVEDAAVDVVTTRSVLIYVADKPRAFQEFYRVLKPGGRLSICEPVNRYFPDPGPPYDMAPIEDLWRKITAALMRAQPPQTNPMLDFDERDLLGFAEQAGFRKIRLDLQVTIAPARPTPWDVWLRSSLNPLEPTPEEVAGQVLTPEEIARCEAYLRPLVESGEGRRRSAVASLWAVK